MVTYTTKLGTQVIEIPVVAAVHPQWRGWRFTENGRYLVTPDGQHLSERRVLGIAWRDAMELRLARFQSRRKAEEGVRRGFPVKVIIVEMADWHREHLGSIAG